MSDDIKDVFGDEWRDCLRAHYQHAVRQDDKVALKTLVPVLQNKIGFGDDELRQLYVEATMHVDDIDFIPDLDIFERAEIIAQGEAAPVPEMPAFQPHPLECQCPECVRINLVPHNEEGQPLDADQQAELEEREAHEARHDSEHSATQLSLF